MLYQVIIEAAKIPGLKENVELFEFDRAEKSRILDELIIPFLRKEKFQFNGYFLSNENIARIVVKTTDIPINSIVDHENSQNPPGFFIYTTREMMVLDDKYTTDVTTSMFKEAEEIVRLQGNVKAETEVIEMDNNNVFIVHGHDELVKLSVARFLEKLKLTPIILHEQASGGATIIEKIEQHSNVGFGIVLYTPCDVGKSVNEEELKLRARQNVVFEHGYLIGKLGRRNVCALVKDEVEKPNDISGVVYINYDSGSGWHSELLKELKNSGYEIDANLLY